MEKPTFKVRHGGAEAGGASWAVIGQLQYNLHPYGSSESNWCQLINSEHAFVSTRKAQIGTLGEAFTLLHAAVVNNHYTGSDLKQRITGNTALYGGTADSQYIYAQDNPEIIDGRIVMNQKSLEARLSSRQIGSVIFSEDGLVRAMPRADLPEELDLRILGFDPIKRENYLIFATGDENSPDKVLDILNNRTFMQGLENPVEEVTKLLDVLIPAIDHSDPSDSMEVPKRILKDYRNSKRQGVRFDILLPVESIVIPYFIVRGYMLKFETMGQGNCGVYSFEAPRNLKENNY